MTLSEKIRERLYDLYDFLLMAFVAATSPIVGAIWRFSDWIQAREERR